jgi:GNAT superfamily N-acetyltransferase
MIVIRRGDKLDVPFLRSILVYAYNWHVNRLDTEIPISRYVDSWGRHGDRALIAMAGGHSVGAGWYRLFPASSPGYGFIDETTPELTIVVVPSRQREGIGKQLLAALLAKAAQDGHTAISVSVANDDAQAKKYLGEGFELVGERGETLTLRRPLEHT